jgi:hypothetical protein
MRSLAKYLILTALCTIPVVRATAQDTVRFKPSGKPVFLVFSNIHTTFSDNKYLTAFELTRGFLGYEYSFSKKLSGKIIYDATSQTVNSTLIMQGYLRNAYLQYDNGKVIIRGGLIGTEQLLVIDKLFNYRYITRPLIDVSGMIFAADLGVSVRYKPTDMVAIDAAMTNGKGYKDLAADSTFRYTTGITLLPVKNLTVRGYFDILPDDQATQWTAGLMSAYSGRTFSLGAEYEIQKNHQLSDGHNYSGLAFFGSYIFNEKIALFARYDDLFSVTPEGETTAWNVAKDGRTALMGIDFTLVKGIRISPNISYIMPDDPGTANKTIAGINIEVKL